MRRTTITIVLWNRMLQTFSCLQPQKPHIKQVYFLFSLFSIFPCKHHFFTTFVEEPPPPPPPQSSFSQKIHTDLSAIETSGIAKSVIFRCSHLWDKKGEFFDKTSLKDLVFKLSNISPETARRFWRASKLKSEDVLEILLGFQFDTGKFECETKKIESMWEIFNWASDQSRDFKHLPQSCEVMASILVRGGLFREVEFLLATMDGEGISLDSNEIFSNLVEGYVGVSELERAVSMYDRMRGQGLVPSLSCFRVILDFLVRMNETQLAFRVFMDMVEMGLGMCREEIRIFENVIQILCRDGKVQEARNVVKKVTAVGMEPSNLVFDAIAKGYCDKKDYDDFLSFFVEMKRAPGVVVGNKIIFSLCRNFGIERANLFMQELEHLGFIPDEVTFGILIGWSCHEGKLKNAFKYLSEVLSRCLKPDIHSYNALIGGVFKEGMWKHAREFLHEMDDRRIVPNMLTFRVLLAGYCKARQFDEVAVMVGEMVVRGLIQLSSLDDPLSKAFKILGLNPLAVKVKRDNNLGFPKTEFYDNLGNGLYLETDLDEYEKVVTGVLQDSIIPDFNSLLIQECDHGNFKVVLVMVDEMVRWGQELSSPAFTALVKGLGASHYCIKGIASLLDKMPKLTNLLDQETLNLLVQALNKKGITHKARVLFGGMLQKSLKIKEETYSTLITSYCKKGNLRGFLDCWKLAQADKWLPELKSYKALTGYLCQKGMLREALELFESMLVAHPHIKLDIFHDFLEKLCGTGFTSTSYFLVEELLKQGCVLDHMAYSHLIRGFCKEKRFSKAFMVFDSMLARSLVPCLDASLLLIPQLCRAGKFEKAAVLKEICLREQSSVSHSVHCALMSGFCEIGMVEEAANLLQEMLLKGVLPDGEVYNMLVQAYCRAKNLRKVGELLGVMIRKNSSISISSYRNLVSLICMEGRLSFALSVKELMLKGSSTCHLVIYNILIFYLFSTGNSLLVDPLLDELQEKGLQLDGVTYNFLVYGFCLSKAVSQSLQYLSTMMFKELRPSNRSLVTVISSLCSDGKLEKALDLSREMESRGWIHGSTIQNAIVKALLAQGKLQEAENFLDRMVEKGLIPENINYDNLIKQLCWHGRQDKAVVLLNIMLKKGSAPGSTSYDSIIQGFCRYHKLDQALDFHTEMLFRNLKPIINTWDVLIQSCCQNGRIAEAERLLNFMVETGETPIREMYCSLINRYRSENNLRRASELMQDMQLKGYEPDFETHWSLISNLSNSSEKDNSNSNSNSRRPFLSRLLSESGFF